MQLNKKTLCLQCKTNFVMKKTVPLTVILPFCNSKRTLAACVESILSQSYSRFELLVADYGSTDGSDEIINTFEDQRIRVVKRANGYARALNSLMKQAKGKYIVRMDAGYRMSDDRLRRQYRFMEAHSEVALAGGCVKQKSFRDTIRRVPLKVTEMALLEDRNIYPTTTIIRTEFWERYKFRYEEQYGESADYALYGEMLYRNLALLNADTVFAECDVWPKEESTESRDAVEDAIRQNIARRIKRQEDEVKRDYVSLPRSCNKLSVLMSFLNEREEVGRTVRSIRETVGNEVDVIVVNDHSDDGYDYESDLEGLDVHYYYNKYRIGAAAGKEKAVQICSTPYFILLDAHMRFYDGNWAKRIVEELNKNPNQLLCCQTRMLRKLKNGKVKDWGEMGVYGAYVDFDDNHYVPGIQWNSGDIATCLEYGQVPAVLGASYCSSKRYWNRLKGLQGLMHYGGEEPYISIKAWLEGGGCRLISDVVIGHLYRERAPYVLVGLPNLYNYFAIIKTLFPVSEQGPALTSFLQRNPKLFKRLQTIYPVYQREIDKLRQYYERSFHGHDFPFVRRINRIIPYEELLVTDTEKGRVVAVASQIMQHATETYTGSLFEGKSGEMLALAEYSREMNDSKADEMASGLLSELVGSLRNPDSPLTFSKGLYGIGWSFVYLLRHGFLENGLESELAYIDRRIMERDVLRVDDLSMETGIGGILAYVIARMGMAQDISKCMFDKMYMSHLKIKCQSIVNEPICNHRTLRYALQFFNCMECRSWNVMPPQVEDILDLPLFLPKEPAYQKKGLIGQAGFVMFLLERQRARKNYRKFKT